MYIMYVKEIIERNKVTKVLATAVYWAESVE